MKILLNNIEVEVLEGETLIEVARRKGYSIPSLCSAKGAKHKASCMVCAIKDCRTGQIIPSCTTLPTEGMQIETESEELKLTRTLSLELLLSDHRADCEAPCRTACPGGMDVATMNRLYDKGSYNEALRLLRDTLVIPATLCYICNAPCEKICRKGEVDQSIPIREIKKELVRKEHAVKNIPVQPVGKKVAVEGSDPAMLAVAYALCRLGYDVSLFEQADRLLVPYIDAASVPEDIIEIETEAILKAGVTVKTSTTLPTLTDFDALVTISTKHSHPNQFIFTAKTKQPARLVLEGRKLAAQLHATLSKTGKPEEEMESKRFNASFLRFSDSEKSTLQEQIQSSHHPSGCLYCDCDKKNDCKLRNYATEYGIKKIRYNKDSTFPALQRQKINDHFWLEQAKCIKCGLCVYNSPNGFTFKDRGFGMQVVLPEENAVHVNEALAELCPTGALYIRK